MKLTPTWLLTIDRATGIAAGGTVSIERRRWKLQRESTALKRR